MRHASWVAAIALTAGGAPVAFAEGQTVEAEALFRQGKELIHQGKLAEGCAKLAASDRMESSVGTLLNLGDCREQLGQRASAWAAFRKAEATARHAGNDDARATEAKRRAEQLEPTLPTLAITVLARVPGETVHHEINGTGATAIDAAAWGTPLPVDAGTYTVTAEAPGYVAWKGTVIIGATGTKRRGAVSIPPLVHVAAVVIAPPAANTNAPIVATPRIGNEPPQLPRDPNVFVRGPTITTQQRTRTWSGLRGFSVGVAALGVGAIATGAYFGVHAGDLSDQANARCPLALCTDSQALQWSRDAHTDGKIANALYLGGGAALAGAAVMWFVGRPDDELVLVPAVGTDHVGVALKGTL